MRILNIILTFFTKLFRLPVYVGVMGFSGQKFDQERAISYLRQGYSEIKKTFPHNQIVIVSGFTNMGIPGLAYNLAKGQGWKTIGVACAKAWNYEVFPCDEVYIVGKEWSDESPTFLKKCLIFVRVGGGDQTIEETNNAKKMGKKVIEFKLSALPKE